MADGISAKCKIICDCSGVSKMEQEIF